MALREENDDPGRVGVSATPAEEDALHRELAVMRGRQQHLEAQVRELERQLLAAETARAEADQRFRRQAALVDEIQRTLSWRITAPLRALSRALRRR
jgi:hypothetical protein